ncbi:MAG: twin-arginine translocase subunit TatC [Candidatus Cloacimonetes bacterium]|nr:twin-arginine translocase subunit TatC [Candidatus Cloacimonadota bacterium]
MNDKQASISDHLKELRVRLIVVTAIFSLFFVICWTFRNDLLNLYLSPLIKNLRQSNGEIVLLNIVDKFQVHMITTAFFSLVLSIPFALYVMGGFVVPALHKKEKKAVILIISCVILLFFGGIVLSYYLIIPITFNYFMQYSLHDKGVFSNSLIKNDLRLSLKSIVVITQQVVLVFGALFQTPLMLLLIHRLGLVKLSKIRKIRKHLYVLFFVISAVLTPPDPLSMIFMALPLILLFEIGLVLCSVFNKEPVEVTV